MKPYFEESGIQIYCGDMLDVLPQYPDRFFGFTFADPPYGIGETGKKNATRKVLAKPTDYGDFNWDLVPWTQAHFDELRRVSVRQAIFGANNFANLLPASSGWIVWDKDNGENDFSDCELAWTSIKCGVRKFKWRWNGMLQEDMSRKEPRWYPTQKPLPLVRWVFAKYARQGKPILDPCFGGGGSLIVAKEFGLQAVGIDKSKTACDVAIERLRQGSLELTA